MVAGVVPLTVSVVGLSRIFPIAGLLIARLAAGEVPPPGAGFTATSAMLPAMDTSAAVNVTLN